MVIKKIILFVLIFITIPILSYSQGSSDCGDNELDPREYCDRGTNIVWFDNIDLCREVIPNSVGNLNCYPRGHQFECQLNITNCSIPGGGDGPSSRSCASCTSCDDPGSFGSNNGRECTRDECSLRCPAFGNCFYAGGDCSSCTHANQCEHYQNEFDCAANICAGNPNMVNRRCEWINGRCRENLDCVWNCDGLYDNDPDNDGFCNKNQGATCILVNWRNRDPGNPGGGISGEYRQACLANNPANNYPDKIMCKSFQEEFPVFTNFNLFLSIFLLIGYYLIILRKKK